MAGGRGRSGASVRGLLLRTFTSTAPTEFTEILEVVQPKVSLDMNRRLLKEFMPNEVHQALKQMHPQKAHRPDGMPPLFFQHY